MTPSRRDLARTLASPATPLSAWATTAFWDDAAAEGVLPLVTATVADAGWDGVPPNLRERASRRVREEAARAELSDRDLRRVLAAFNARSTPTLLLKGTALGYTHYRSLRERPRLDVDLLIRAADIAGAHAVFESLAAQYLPHVSGRYVLSQFHYVTTDGAGCRHAYDVHWRIVNAHRFASALSFDELQTAAVTPAALASVAARTPSPVHALLIACVHRAAHHAGQGPLIWLYDMHLLSERLERAEQQAFAALARDRRLAGVAAQALAETASAFGGAVAAALAGELQGRAGMGAGLGYRPKRRSRAHTLLDDLTVLDSWRARAGLLREVLLPPAGYMRTGYAPGSRAPLALLYLRRAASGAIGFVTR